MPRLKQPASLESIVLQSIRNLVLELGRRLLAKVCSGQPSAPTWGIPSHLKLTRNKCQRITKLQLFLHPDLPLRLSDAVTSTVLEAISTLVSTTPCTNDCFSKSGDDCCREVIENLVAGALHPRISHLDLLQWPWFMGEVLLKHLHELYHLQVLKLCPGNWSPVWATVVTMLEKDRCLTGNLVSFSMRCHCTDKIVEVLGNSTTLRHLDIMSSVDVTDASVDSLLKLNNLRILNVASTAISADGYIVLLEGLPHLGKLLWFDLGGQALGKVDRRPLRLHSYEASRVTIGQIDDLVRTCPYLTRVSFHWLQADLAVLGALKHLRDVKLANCSARNCNLQGLLETIGHNILLLELHEVTSVDLLMIGALCPNVRKLNLFCELEPPAAEFVVSQVQPFQEVEELVFGSAYSECLFHNCTNLKKLEISKCRDFNDGVLATLLLKNPLKHLEVLSAVNCGRLSLAALHMLLASCDNLTRIEGLESWGGVNKLQVADICAELERKNLNISILWKKPIEINW
ncbi:hypothetical protein C0J52_04205 [Blattella germanica]|nr:hypothetical protein C0J52_04205 [Blattella germanica]